MTTGLVGDLGLEQVPDGLPDSVYAGFLFDLKTVNYKDAAKGKALVFTYKVSEGQFTGETHDEWKSANAFDDMQKKRFLKQRLASLGVPESKFGSVTREDLVGTPVLFTIKANGQYRNVTKVELRNASAAAPVGQPATQQATTQQVTPATVQDVADLI